MNGRTKTKSDLVDLIVHHFSEPDLRQLCFDLEIPYDKLRGSGTQEKSISLIEYWENRNQLDDLLEVIIKKRPNLSPQVIEIQESLHKHDTRKVQLPFFTPPKKVWIMVVGGTILILILLFVGGRWLGNFGGDPTAVPANEFIYQVKVQDAVSGMPLQRVKVTLATSGGLAPETQISDVNGTALFKVPSSQVDRMAILSVEKEGYRNFTQNITLKPDQLPQDVMIQPDS